MQKLRDSLIMLAALALLVHCGDSDPQSDYLKDRCARVIISILQDTNDPNVLPGCKYLRARVVEAKCESMEQIPQNDAGGWFGLTTITNRTLECSCDMHDDAGRISDGRGVNICAPDNTAAQTIEWVGW